MVEKYYNDEGEVAVLYSPGYGMGWYSWYSRDSSILFDKEIVKAILDKDFELAKKIIEVHYPHVQTGGVYQLEIEWMNPGTCFNIKDHDGYERIEYCDPCCIA